MSAAGGPLAGRTIVITRDEARAASLQAGLAARGAVPVLCPVVAIGPPESWTEVDGALARWDRIEWVVFPSANAVTHLLDRMAAHDLGGDAWRGKRVAAVGEATAAELAARGIAVAAVPRRHTGAELARLLLARHPRPAGEALIPRSSRAREELAERLAAGGWRVQTVTAYANTPADPGPDIRERLEAADAILFAAPSAVEGFAAVAGADYFHRHPGVLAAAIGPVTAATLAELAPAALVVAEPHTSAGLLRSLERYFASNRGGTTSNRAHLSGGNKP
ncbi:MAG TPA: uroporphyrinogen-III synthase [Acidobacteriota bacterium]|nr:uroporphyrinogen-III synthase [Acidobacteriota bacterium]HQM62476.1 uroporphyrinogen-III synthase [Acidobacteriota bacterium]